MRIVSTSNPRDSKTVRAYFSIFIASPTCCWYCARSRLRNAVIARIFCFSCGAACGVRVCAGVTQGASITSRRSDISLEAKKRNSEDTGINNSRSARYIAPLHESGNAGDPLSDHQLVNVVRALIGEHALEV